MPNECWIFLKYLTSKAETFEIPDKQGAGTFEIHDQRVLDLLNIHQILRDLSQNLNFVEGKILIKRLNVESYWCGDRVLQMSLIYD